MAAALQASVDKQLGKVAEAQAALAEAESDGDKVGGRCGSSQHITGMCSFFSLQQVGI